MRALLLNMKIQHHSGGIDSEMMALLLTADPDEAAVLKYIDTAKILVALVSGKVIAIAVITMNGTESELKNIAVASDHQGHGIAKSLISAAKNVAKESGASSLIVGTGNSSLSQMALYQKCGFRLFSIVPNYFADYPEPIYENGIRCIDMVVLRVEL